MFKTTATLPYLAALLAANTIGLEIVSLDHHTVCDAHKQSPPGERREARKVSDNTNRTPNRVSRRLSGAFPLLSREKQADAPTDECGPPLFRRGPAGTSIRRLYPSKISGRAALAATRVDRKVSAGKHSKRSSVSSAMSVQDSPSPVAELRSRTNIKSPLTRKAGYHKRGPSLPVIDGSIGRAHSFRRSKSFEISEDTGYGTMETAASSVATWSETLVMTKDVDQTPTKVNPRPMTSDSIITTSTYSKGHRRAQSSIASIWDLDVEDVSPAPIKRRPLQLNTRPPLPNFSTPPSTLRDSMQTACKSPARSTDGTPRWMSSQKQDTPKALNRQLSARTNRQSILSSHPSESWDEDFSELALEVPESIRESQATLRGHLWQLQQFSNQIAELKFLRDKYNGTNSVNDSVKSRIWEETDALLAIASQGDEENGLTTYRHDPTHDATISDILGIEPGFHGKIRLDGEFLQTLVCKADNLIGDICETYLL